MSIDNRISSFMVTLNKVWYRLEDSFWRYSKNHGRGHYMKKVGQLCVSILALMPAPLLAQGADGTDVEAPQSADTDRAVEAEGDIVITGSRLRQESVQDTPIAVAVMSAAQVEKLNATDIIGLSGKIPT